VPLIYRIESGKKSRFLGIKLVCRRGRNWLALHSSNRSWAPFYIHL